VSVRTERTKTASLLWISPMSRDLLQTTCTLRRRVQNISRDFVIAYWVSLVIGFVATCNRRIINCYDIDVSLNDASVGGLGGRIGWLAVQHSLTDQLVQTLPSFHGESSSRRREARERPSYSKSCSRG
jgi:hypothetical protein